MHEKQQRSVLAALLGRYVPATKSRRRPLRRSMAHPRTSTSNRVMQFEVTGKVVGGNRSMYAIDGEDIEIDTNTWIIGVLKVGAFATVRGIIQPGIGKYATKITVK